MKKVLLLLLVAGLTFGAQAQKITLKKGDLKFLKGTKVLGVTFTYDNLTVGKMSEADYIDKKVAEANERNPGSGNKWTEKWYADRLHYYQPKFIELFDKVVMEKGVSLSENTENTDYIMIVKTTFIEPGFNVGVMKKAASTNLEVDFVATIDPATVLTTFTIDKTPGATAFGGDYDAALRVSESYAKAAKYFAKYLLKKKAF